MKKAFLILILAGIFTGHSFAQLQKGQVDPRKADDPGLALSTRIYI